MRANMDKLRGKIVENKSSHEKVADALGIDPSTFSRKMKSDGINFTIGQVHKLSDALGLSAEEVASIFLIEDSHKCEGE